MTDIPSETVDALQTTALLIRHVCRRDTSVMTDALESPSFRAIARGLGPIHELTRETILLKSGIRLGLIKMAGTA